MPVPVHLHEAEPPLVLIMLPSCVLTLKRVDFITPWMDGFRIAWQVCMCACVHLMGSYHTWMWRYTIHFSLVIIKAWRQTSNERVWKWRLAIQRCIVGMGPCIPRPTPFGCCGCISLIDRWSGDFRVTVGVKALEGSVKFNSCFSFLCLSILMFVVSSVRICVYVSKRSREVCKWKWYLFNDFDLLFKAFVINISLSPLGYTLVGKIFGKLHDWMMLCMCRVNAKERKRQSTTIIMYVGVLLEALLLHAFQQQQVGVWKRELGERRRERKWQQNGRTHVDGFFISF